MAMYNDWFDEKILILVKTYPCVSTKYQETVCTAGISSKNELIRIYPIKYRYLSDDKQFEKYRWISAKIIKSDIDSRPESYKINYDTINLLEKLDSKKDAEIRKKIIAPLISSSIEEIKDKCTADNTSLGIFAPRSIDDFIIEPCEKDWTDEEKMILRQQSFDGQDVTPLEKIPYDFSFKYRCDDIKCKGHKMKMTDWELYQTYRNFRKMYGEQEGIKKVKDKWLGLFNSSSHDTYFITGNTNRFKTFILIGYAQLIKSLEQISFF